MRSFVDMDLEPRREASSVQLRSWGKALPVSVVFRNRKGIWGEREGGGARCFCLPVLSLVGGQCPR